MSAKIGSLNVDVTLETARFKAGARALSAETKKLEGRFGGLKAAGATLAGGLAGLGAGVVIGGLQEAVSGAFELASSMSEAASRVGLTVEALQELRVAAQDNGVSNEALESSMGRLNVQLGKLQAGAKPASAAFAAIGLSAADLKGLRPEESFARIADAIAAIKDPAEQAAAAQAIFGKSYAQLLPLIKAGSGALKEAAEESRRNGQITTEQAAQLDYLADTWEKLKVRVGVATAQIIANASKMPAELTEGFRQIADGVIGLRDSFVATANGIQTAIENMVTGIGRAITGRLGAIWDGAKKKFESFRNTLKNFSMTPASFEGGGGLQNASFFNIGQLANDNADETELANVRIAKSFKDMADETLSALSGLSNAIKGGGFLDILQGVIGLGLQLGGAGLFGSKIAGRINAPSIPTGGSGLRGGASKGTTIQVLPSPMFEVVVNGQVQQAKPDLVRTSVAAANSNTIFQRSRRLG